MSAAMRVLHLDETPPVDTPWDGVPAWTPVRRLLDVGAFGVNVQTAAAVGDPLIEPHDETASGHEELYVVLRGSATVTAGDRTVDVRAGSLVFLPDPTVHRSATATAPDTAVLAVGAARGTAYAPPAWEERWARELGLP
ncbi:cupin domain-containing protein [Paraconexibacter algicola]|uniref:Cupin type-2 domain-containing protein n=1 Tax=Paraconexibacter algicola TaxID=2133960 RepID=A0A2T4UFA1_9ACTN|nr:cupin domain-containing protein [Paraconexibacter algicola]PTL56461.1 hypothetical protein C7Y72_15990 [Paraconexibacter algicola]